MKFYKPENTNSRITKAAQGDITFILDEYHVRYVYKNNAKIYDRGGYDANSENYYLTVPYEEILSDELVPRFKDILKESEYYIMSREDALKYEISKLESDMKKYRKELQKKRKELLILNASLNRQKMARI